MQVPEFKRPLILSDLHLGNPNSQTEKFVSFTKSKDFCEADCIILNGDILDLWRVFRKHSMSRIKVRRHFLALYPLLKAIKKQEKKVIYVLGNHDEYLENLIEEYLVFDNFEIHRDCYVFDCAGKRNYVLHGHQFDLYMKAKRYKRILPFIDASYGALCWVNRMINHISTACGYGPWSLAKSVKLTFKKHTGVADRLKDASIRFVKDKFNEMDNFNVINGHTHMPLALYGSPGYFNSGCWCDVLSCTYLKYNGKHGPNPVLLRYINDNEPRK